MGKEKLQVTTLNDIAKQTGFSLATVSRVLSGADYPVSLATKKKILLAADELNYTPNMVARMLKGSTFHTIGVIVPTLQNPYFNQVILGIESVAWKHNIEIMILSSHRDIQRERNNINSLLQNRVMALIIISIDTDSSTLENYISCGGKVAMLESNFRLENTIITETDHPGAGRLAAEHLIQYGHRKIAFLTSPLTKSYRRSILAGVRDTLWEREIPFEESDVFVASRETEAENGLYEFELGKQLVDSFWGVQSKYTAIIAINDITAFGIIQALVQHGLSIPRDISVISFDNIVYSEMFSPALTTVELPSSNLGSTTCNLLINSFPGKDLDYKDVTFRFQGHLVERSSVSSPRF